MFKELLVKVYTHFAEVYLFTVELQWLEHLWDYETLFEARVVRAIEGLQYSQVRKHNRDNFSIFFNMKVHCVFSLESPQ